MTTEHLEKQRQQVNSRYKAGARHHTTNSSSFVAYLVQWRIKEGIQRLMKRAQGRLSNTSKVLVMCAGDGYDGSILCDMGFENVTVSDISDVGVAVATERDQRLQGLVLNAECTNLAADSFDLVVVQDGLHHLQNPVLGFTEMLRVATVGVLFLEPHDSIVGNVIGTKWERNGEAVNYVFRWTKKLVQDVTSSYLGSDSFDNLSFSFWHHNIVLKQIGQMLGGNTASIYLVEATKTIFDTIVPGMGNQFCGLVLKH